MVPFRFKNVCIEAMAVHLPTQEVTSAEIEDKIAPLYQKLEIPFGTLEKLSGIKTRYMFPVETMPSDVATIAAREAVEKCGIAREDLRAVLSCSVTRDYFEPATACLVHHNLELAEDALVMDVSNACIGFSNGMVTLAHMIEAGTVKAGIVVSGEVVGRMVQNCLDHLLKNSDTITREDLIKILPVCTLGSGAVAYVLCHESISKNKHRFLGGALRSATQYHDLCNGNGDHCLGQLTGFNPIMYTESSKLIASAARVGARTWSDASEVLGWSREEVDHIFCHQVGRQVNDAFYREMGLDLAKEFTIYKKYGNLVSAALPTALAMGIEAKGIKSGDKIVMTAFGSGLNAIFSGVQW